MIAFSCPLSQAPRGRRGAPRGAMAQRDGEPENAAELEFGKDLNNCECLSTSEVAEFFSKYEPGPREKRCAAPGMPKPPARAAHVWAATFAVIR